MPPHSLCEVAITATWPCWLCHSANGPRTPLLCAQVKETAKIWGENDVAITATCIRVPVMRAHAESINLEFEKDISGAQLLFLISLVL